jgi:hypothetical protein
MNGWTTRISANHVHHANREGRPGDKKMWVGVRRWKNLPRNSSILAPIVRQRIRV